MAINAIAPLTPQSTSMLSSPLFKGSDVFSGKVGNVDLGPVKLQEAGVIYKPTLGRELTLVRMDGDVYGEFEKNQLMRHGQEPIQTAAAAVQFFHQNMSAIGKIVEAYAPDAQEWDLSFKAGRVVVLSEALDKATKAKIEGALNTYSGVVDAAKNFFQAAIDRYETTEENPPYYGDVNSVSRLLEYHDVREQTEGKLPIKEMVEWVTRDKVHTRWDQASPVYYLSGLDEFVGSRLSSSERGPLLLIEHGEVPAWNVQPGPMRLRG